jgi:hypothetical protein
VRHRVKNDLLFGVQSDKYVRALLHSEREQGEDNDGEQNKSRIKKDHEVHAGHPQFAVGGGKVQG